MRLLSPLLSNGEPPRRPHCSKVVVRDRIELSTFRFSGGRSYRLSYLTRRRSAERYLGGPDGI